MTALPPTTPNRFTMPSDQAGPKCIYCDTALNRVYRTSHKDDFTFREHLCPNCGRKNTTIQRTVERPDF